MIVKKIAEFAVLSLLLLICSLACSEKKAFESNINQDQDNPVTHHSNAIKEIFLSQTLPWPAGTKGTFGCAAHKIGGNKNYAYDFSAFNNNGDILSTAPGTITYVEYTGKSMTGKFADTSYIKIAFEDDPTYEAVYLHFASNTIPRSLTIGQSIPRGTYLGRMGDTGNATAPHLHYHVQPAMGVGGPYVSNNGVFVDFEEYKREGNQIPNSLKEGACFSGGWYDTPFSMNRIIAGTIGGDAPIVEDNGGAAEGGGNTGGGNTGGGNTGGGNTGGGNTGGGNTGGGNTGGGNTGGGTAETPPPAEEVISNPGQNACPSCPDRYITNFRFTNLIVDRWVKLHGDAIENSTGKDLGQAEVQIKAVNGNLLTVDWPAQALNDLVVNKYFINCYQTVEAEPFSFNASGGGNCHAEIP